MELALLEKMALREVEALRRQLPPELARRADVPVVMMARPTPAMVRDEGVDPDLLGLFMGPTCAEGVGDSGPLSPEILLFLENLWDFAEGDIAAFREEVRVTYCHELGHYIGFDEDELAHRGLD